jgi:predicted dehydrogenase
VDRLIRGAIAGFGQVAARAHLAGWLTRPAINVNVIFDPVAERRHEAFRLIRGVRVYDHFELMLDGEAPNFVDIASPPAMHADLARLALGAGASVLVEKPLALTLEDFEDLARLADARGCVMMCVHNWKFAPPYRVARAAIADGRIGAVHLMSIDRLRTEPAGAGGAGVLWRKSAPLGGGILIDHGWHVFYLMQWLLGGAAPRSVTARLGFPTGSDADDDAELEIVFDGCAATSHLSWRAAERRTSARIIGERGHLEIEGDRVLLVDNGGKASDLSVADAPDDSYHAAWFAGVAAEFEAVLAAGAASEGSRLNRKEARNCIAIIEAARRSAARDGKILQIDGSQA